MNKATRVKLFLTEYKALCEKYKLSFNVDRGNDLGGITTRMGYPFVLTIVDWDGGNTYPVNNIKESLRYESCSYEESISAHVKSYKENVDEVVEPYESMPELTKGFIGKSQKTDEEIREELAADGVFI